MAEYSILIPFETDHADREIIFRWLEQYYRAHFPEAEVLFGGDGHKPGEPINRSRMRNRLVARATTDILVLIDADCLVMPDHLREAVVWIKRREGAMVQFNDVTWLNEDGTRHLIGKNPTHRITVPAKAIRSANDAPLWGLVFILHRHTYNDVGGMDERMLDWGEEDPAFRALIQKVAGPIVRVPYTAYHLHHSRAPEHSHGTVNFQRNKILRDICEAANGREEALDVVREVMHPRKLLRILAISTGYLPDIRAGAERSLHTQLKWLQRRGHAVTVAVKRSSVEEYEGIPLLVTPTPAALAILVREADVVYANHGGIWEALPTIKAGKTPTVVHLVNDLNASKVLQQIRPHVHAITGNSPAVCASLQTTHCHEPVVMAAEYQVPHPGRCITLINLSVDKGVALFYRLATRLPQYQFLGVKGAYDAQIMPEHPLPNLRILETQADMREVYRQTRVLVMPSWPTETWGRTAMEAACSGIPTIGSPTPGLRYVLDDEQMLRMPDDEEGWVTLLTALMEDRQYYQQQSDAAKHRFARYQERIPLQLQALEHLLVKTAFHEKRFVMPEMHVISQVDVLASERHFLDHLLPIWKALPEQARGLVVVPHGLAHYAGKQGIPAQALKIGEAVQFLSKRTGLLLVCSSRDGVVGKNIGRTLVFCEHGAGQAYSNRHTSYAGGHGGGREAAALFLVPNDYAAALYRRAYPSVPVKVIGCPKLDAWTDIESVRHPQPVVCISWHWDCKVCPETQSAWPYFYRALPLLVARAKQEGWKLIGHAHPRIFGKIVASYREHGIEAVDNFDEVLERADLYCVDNSSTLFEFAATGRPVVVMNPPCYRPKVKHGLRFWDCAGVGLNVNTYDKIPDVIAEALRDPEPVQRQRERIIQFVYPVRGNAAQVAAAAIMATQGLRQTLYTKRTGMTMHETTTTQIEVEVTRKTPFFYRGKARDRGTIMLMDIHHAELYSLQGWVKILTPRAEDLEQFLEPSEAPVSEPGEAPVDAPDEIPAESAPDEAPLPGPGEIKAEPIPPHGGVILRYTCSDCGEQFDTSAAKRAHMRSHQGTRKG